MKVALVHDWLNGMRGGEKVLSVLCELFPQAPIYTLLCEPQKIDAKILQDREVHTSWIQRSGLLRKNYRALLPFMPAAMERFNLNAYDLVISSSHCVAKGVRLQSHTRHVSYCHTPMRYLWDFQQEYFGSSNLAKRVFLEPVLNRLRNWDVQTAKRVDHFIANSHFVADRIRRVYGREADVLAPPVDTDYFAPQENAVASRDLGGRDGYFLMVSALVPYKKVELVLEVFARSKHNLVIVGTGPLEAALRRKATSNVRFLGWAAPEVLREYYRGCRALLFPQREDFGIVPLEAQACARPVIAFAQGGALETVVGHPKGHVPVSYRLLKGSPTGVFFGEQTVDSLAQALETFVKLEGEFEPKAIRQNALAFDKSIFRESLRNYMVSKVPQLAHRVPTHA